MNSTAIATQIGNRAFWMMGAKRLTGSSDGSALTWAVGRGAKGTRGQVTHVRVTLEASDTYRVETLRVNTRAKEMTKTLETETGIYCDGLRACISRLTGMALSLGTMGR